MVLDLILFLLELLILTRKVKQQIIEKIVEYTVGMANASIALDEMNVLYIGYDNNVTIAASGGGDDKVQASITGGGGIFDKGRKR